MSKAITVTLLAAVTFNGALLEKGDVVELSENSARSLIAEGGAEASEATGSDLSGSEGSGTQKPTDDETGDQDEALAIMTKALDDKYVNRIPELKEHAVKADIQFAHDATKKEVIEAVLAAGKGDTILAI